MDLFCDIYCMDTINNTSFGYKHLKKKKNYKHCCSNIRLSVKPFLKLPPTLSTASLHVTNIR